MDADAFNAALERIGLTQVRLANLLQRHKGTVNRWALGLTPIPYEVAIVLGVLDQTDLAVEDLAQLAAAVAQPIPQA